MSSVLQLDGCTIEAIRHSLPAGWSLSCVYKQQRGPKYRLLFKVLAPGHGTVTLGSASIATLAKGRRNTDGEQALWSSLSVDKWLAAATPTSTAAAAAADKPGAAAVAAAAAAEERPVLGSSGAAAAAAGEAARKAAKRPLATIAEANQPDSSGNKRGGVRLGAGRPLGRAGAAEKRQLLQNMGSTVSAQLLQLETGRAAHGSQVSLRDLRELYKVYKQLDANWAASKLQHMYNRGHHSSKANQKVQQSRLMIQRDADARVEMEQWVQDSIAYLEALLYSMFDTSADDHQQAMEELVYDNAEQQALSLLQNRQLYQRALALRMFYVVRKEEPAVSADGAKHAVAKLMRIGYDTLRKWESTFRQTGKLRVPRQGRWERTFLLAEEDLKEKATQFVMKHSMVTGQPNMTVADFHKFINDTIMPLLTAGATGAQRSDRLKGLRFSKIVDEVTGNTRYEVSKRTAGVWLRQLGFGFNNVDKKGVYFDGHDRKDVVDYRQTIYLPDYMKLRQYERVWLKLTKAEAEERGLGRAWIEQRELEGVGDERLETGQLWVCVEELAEVLAEQPDWLQGKLTSKELLRGKTVLKVYQDESIYKCEYHDRSSHAHVCCSIHVQHFVCDCIHSL